MTLPNMRMFGMSSGASLPLYAFTTATFTTGGQTGSTGPDLTTARAGLTGTGTDAWKNNTAYFNTSNGIQLWTVPTAGNYRIEAYGAKGGDSVYYSQIGGSGASMVGTFALQTGAVLKILCGQMGVTGNYDAAGGGGTFVTTNTNSPLIIAAGGGGASASGYIGTGLKGGNGASGNGSSTSGGRAGGTNGSGGAGEGAGNAGGGGGLTGNGTGTWFGTAFVNGGAGGSDGAGSYMGGFGGGGGGGGFITGAAGGGGYSGGAAEVWANDGGGGGSFNSGSSQVNTSTANAGAGRVIITKL